MDLNALFQSLQNSNRVKMPPGGMRVPEGFVQRAKYGATRPFVPPSPWPTAVFASMQAGATRPAAAKPSPPSHGATAVTPVMEDYMRQLTQAIMTDPTGKTVADLSQRIAEEALACAGLAPAKGAMRPPPAPAPAKPHAPLQKPTATPATREAMTSPTPPQAVLDAREKEEPAASAAAAALASVLDSPSPTPVAARFARYAEAARIACGLPGPMPDPSTPTTSFWNYMAELAEHTGVRIYIRVSPLFARCVGTTKRAMIILDAVNNAAEVLHPRGSMDDALTFLHDKDIDVEYTATTLKKYKVPEVQGVAQRYGVPTHAADTGKKKVKDALIQDILHDIESRARACEQSVI